MESTATLTLDTATITGTDVTDKGGITINTNPGRPRRQGRDHQQWHDRGGRRGDAARCQADQSLVATGSIIQVDDGQTLTLSGTEIIGGTINDARY